MKIFLDDIRFTPSKYDLTFKNAEDLIEWVKDNPTTEVTLLSLDHDLGDDIMSGADMCHQLVYLENNIKEIQFHTSNYQGLKNMYSILSSAQRVGWMKNLERINPHKIETIDGVEETLYFYDVRIQ